MDSNYRTVSSVEQEKIKALAQRLLKVCIEEGITIREAKLLALEFSETMKNHIIDVDSRLKISL